MLAFIKLGHLFTSAMTGNTALLAIALGQGDVAAAGRSLQLPVPQAVQTRRGIWRLNSRRFSLTVAVR